MMRLLILFLSCLSLYAAPIGSASAPKVIEKGFFTHSDDWMNVRLGYEGDFVVDGRMNQYNQGSGRVDTYEQWTHSGTFTLNLVERLDLYGVFGSSQTKADWRFSNGEMIQRAKLHTGSQYLWAVGARAVLYEWWRTALALGGRYSACDYPVHHLSVDGVSELVSGSRLAWTEWQINLDLSYQISWLMPYIGTKYLHAQGDLTGFSVPISSSLSSSNTFKNRNPVGLYLGCILSNGSYFMLTLEGRVIDEEAVTVSCDFRF